MNVDLRHIHKTFGKVHANDDISLDIPAGTIQGILGENGAGKSTLMKVLSGFIYADAGEIRLDGRATTIHSPADAIRQGIGMLHQDPLDFPPMKILDNFLLGRAGGLFPDRKTARRDFLALAAQFDFSLDPEAYVDRLTVGERQQLEILRLLWLGARALILDEPTTGISLPQKEKLFATLKKLAAQGMTILFVSHKLEDVEALCGRVSVLRQGKLVEMMTPPFDAGRLVESMFGKQVTLAARTPARPGLVTLRAQNLSLEDSRLQIHQANLDVRAGEVIGLAGMEGSGQTLFLRACAGLLHPVAGKTLVGGRDLTGQAHHAFKKQGVAYLPASRMEEGLIPGLTLTDHFVLAEKMRGVFINREAALGLARQRISAFNIKGTPASTVESLSGGNQQRALLALLQTPLNLILLEHPTRGLDIESTLYIWAKLKERCAQGSAILFISADLDEILQYSDRVLVFFAGRVSPPLDAAQTSVTQLGQLIGGKGWETLAGEAAHA
ncbi:MAG: sugar ABC transporter ATP-binding protein [Anaerolineae bacterium CG_4_9_14_3_um_filter_57_17]|nr:ATP-binding cassette domain-containing protein [bacterium]NCT21008.1 ATP-binding cassette domain-containing protein [bacterium]OIO83369.1 MAG: sugar ABC transporter ATP-binding protein [Anaerolineae bacterium CG2_30_57_67]PJB68368.1 MAG: sugar ABC transporter ATP-binding protein [Anaerolineae bacterium CG_4_9_14_3_um_filter_57_17]